MKLKNFLKIFCGVVAILLGLRITSSLLLLADRSSDWDVLKALFGLFALIGIEYIIFWDLFFKKRSRN